MKRNRLIATIVGLIVFGVVAAVLVVANRAPDYASVSIEQLRRPDSGEAQLGEQVEIDGVIVGDFRQADQLGGFFLQQVGSEPSSLWQAIFVNCSEFETIAVGDRVRVRGVIDVEDNTLQIKPAGELTSVEIERMGTVGLPAPFDLSLPSDSTNWDSTDWDSLIGMLVSFPGDMVVNDTYDWARYGQVILSPERRLYIPTNYIDPNDSDPEGTNSTGNGNVANVTAVEQQDRQRTLILDDGLTIQNPNTLALQPAGDSSIGSLRLGSTIKNLTGIITKFKGKYMVLPVGEQAIEYAQRPPRPTLGDANLTVASFNVLNYFTTIDDGKNGARGADTDAELDRQRQKLIAAMVALEADILGLMELENNLESEQRLVAALNQTLGSEVYSGVGLPDQFSNAPGADNPIRVGLIYRRDRVEPTGAVAMVVDDAFSNARTPLAQQFRRIDGEAKLTVIVNHFKSKGSQDAKDADADQNDGQSSYNASRRNQAAAIVRYVQSIERSAEADKVLIIGDLNAYAQEDPIDMLRDAGLVDLLQQHRQDEQPYSYVYRGRAGCLDHAFATSALASDVVGAAAWHINSDEPRCLDYNQEYNPESFYQPDPFRSSDHDPVLIGIRFE